MADLTPEAIRWWGLGCLLVGCALVGWLVDYLDWDWEPELEPEVTHPETGKPMMWRRTKEGSYEWVERA